MMFLDEKMQEVANFVMNNNSRKNYFQGEDADALDRLHEFGYINITHEGKIVITQKLLSEL